MKAGIKIVGYILGAIAAASYGLNPSFALPLYAAGVNPDSVLTLRYGIAIIMVGAMMLIKGESFRIPRKSILPLLCLGLLMSLSSFTLFESYNYMAAGIASTMLFVYPIMVAVIMAAVYHERLSLLTVLCIMVATGGIALLYNSEEGTTLSFVGTLFVMASALSYAIYLVAVGRKAFQGIPTLTLTFYELLFGSLLFAGRFVSGAYTFTPPTTPILWACAAALALFPTVISFFCTARAINLVGSTPTAILGALEPVTAVVMGILFFGETVSVRELIGIIMILAAVSLVIAAGAKNRS